MAAIKERELMIIKKQLIPTVAAVFLLGGCSASAAASAATGGGSNHGTTTAAAVSAASHTKMTPDSADGTPAGALPFPVGDGYTWVYRAVNTVGTGTATSTTTTKITSVQSTSAGLRVTEYFSISADSKFDGSSVWIFHPNGTITYPLAQGLGGMQITHSSGGILFPTAAEVTTGKPYHSSLTMTVVEAGQTITETAHITVRGDGTQTVTVPAGTFRNATVLEMAMDVVVDKIPIDFNFKYWVANGTGEVKSEGFFGGSTPNETSVLVSFTK
jgi:uncharacterized protein DUF3108